jgi:hypothetical protein
MGDSLNIEIIAFDIEFINLPYAGSAYANRQRFRETPKQAEGWSW